MRIDKLLEERGFGSRKAVKRLFQKKLVKVDGKTVTHNGLNVDAALQQVTVNGQRIKGAEHVYYLMNKPHGVVSAVQDANNQTVLDLIKPEDQRAGLHPVGRLDRDTKGFLLLTDNGQLSYQLVLPDKWVSKTYEATVNEPVTATDIQAFANGIVFLDGTVCQPAVLTILASSEQESQVRLVIYEGKFHQVKKMFLAVGKKVTELKRISMGPLVLDESLTPGEYRPLSREELESLRPYFR